MPQQPCPLCGRDASFHATSIPEGKCFTCQHCIEFWIDEYSEDHIASIPEVARSGIQQKLSLQAQKTSAGHLYVIREPKHNEITGDGYGVAKTSLKTAWVKI